MTIATHGHSWMGKEGQEGWCLITASKQTNKHELWVHTALCINSHFFPIFHPNQCDTTFSIRSLQIADFLPNQGVELCAYSTSGPIRKNSPVGKEFSWTGELLLDTEDSLDSAKDSMVIEDFAFSDQRNFFRIPPYCKLSLSGRQSMPPTGISG